MHLIDVTLYTNTIKCKIVVSFVKGVVVPFADSALHIPMFGRFPIKYRA